MTRHTHTSGGLCLAPAGLVIERLHHDAFQAVEVGVLLQAEQAHAGAESAVFPVARKASEPTQMVFLSL